MENPSSQGNEPSKLHKSLGYLLKGSVTLLVIAVIIGTFQLFNVGRMVEQLELKSYDLRAQVRWAAPSKKPSPEVVILAFDDSTMNFFSDEFGVWPWPRDVHAQMIDFMNKVGVRSILYDIMFVSHRKGSEAADQQFIDTFRKYDNVYLSMNFDNELAQSKKLGKDLTPEDIEMLRPLSIKLKSHLDQAPKSTNLKLQTDSDGTTFFDNHYMTFNHYRSIMKDLLATGRNIGIINHGANDDGVSRGNPLFFRFKYQPFIKTTALPLTQKGDRWYDAKGQRVDSEGYLYRKSVFLPVVPIKENTYQDQNPQAPQSVDAEGYLLDDYGNPIYQHEDQHQSMYFPYLGLRAVLDLKFPKKAPQLTLTKEGHLKFANYDIPLDNTGDFLVNWHNIDVKRQAYEEKQRLFKRYVPLLQETLQAQEKAIAEIPAGSSERDRKTKELYSTRAKLQSAQQSLQILDTLLQADYVPQPYQMIPAWEVIRVMQKEQAGLPLTKEDVQLKEDLKNKIVFVGATAVAAYDIKNTSIHSAMPGVVLQANLFDNLYQGGKKYLRRAEPGLNLAVTLFICLLSAGCTFRMRSPLAGILTTANISVLYMLVAIVLYHSFNLWINIAMPMVALITTTTLTFMLKYFFRDKDYEKTYAMATTDSMTGLYNHRFFQDHMRRSIDQANRFKHKFSLLLIDIDFFKKFNDTYGHQAGDEVLRQVAKKLKKNVRNVDIVARYGGEEMAIILDRATEEEALIVAQKIVKAVAEEAYPIAEGVAKHVTISCGVSTYPTHGNSPSELIEFSDAGLYRAKEHGRNQVGAQYDSTTPPDGDGEHKDGKPAGHDAHSDSDNHHAA